MEIIKEMENGKLFIDKQAFTDISQSAIRGMKDVYPPKKGKDYCFCKIKDNILSIKASVKLKQGIDVVKVCSKIQNNIHEAIEEMTGIDCEIINVDIQGFVSK